ncbi:ArnT family glycosyltransferase [Herbiconiux liangxiaofengii]|uniref:ArnT family glycosyltransferase n=1 Tax=Herbiconiux liangxiaofengii TaxID=3342795 RepID=UPI0035B6CD27
MKALRSRLLTPWALGLAALTAASGFITLWALQAGQRSEYYAAIALSMSRSWSNFFFGAFDPAGTVTLDKIPGSFWIPAAFVKLFGFSTWSVNAPNAIATVAAVLVVAFTAKRLLGPGAGLVAGAVVASTPIVAAVARSNQPESFFVLALALVAWAATKAVQRASGAWLVVAGALVALGFQFYMLESWAVWPALAAGYLCTRQPWGRKLLHVGVAGAISLALSLVWIVIVWLVPAGSRPYIGGTESNNPFEMVFGYNGLGRFSATSDSDAYRSFTPPFSGDAGALRLFNAEVAPQVAWLIPAALVAVVVLWLVERRTRALTVLLGAWLITFLAMFSAVAGMHQFYTAALAVPLALLVGLAFASARRAGLVWPQVALVLTASATALAVGLYQPAYLYPVAVGQAVLAVAVSVLLVVRRRRRAGARVPDARWLAVVTAAALVLTPAAWSLDAMNHENSINPIAGAGSSFGGGGFGGGAAGGFGGARPGGGGAGAEGAVGDGGGRPGAAAPTARPSGVGGFGGSLDATTLAWLQQNQGSARYLVATFGAQAAASIITATDGGSVLPVGGFNGLDPVPTLAQFQQLVADGDLRYVLATTAIGGQGGFGGQGAQGAGVSTTASSEIEQWVEANCSTVTSSQVDVNDLYDCAP